MKVPKPKPASRREARRAAVFVLYQWDVTSSPLGSLFEGDVDAYTQTIADRVAAHAEELDARITDASDDWTADRLGAVERNILRVAIEDTLDSDMVDGDYGNVVDAVVLWWRSEDGDLVDGLVDSLTDLVGGGVIWLFTPKVGRPNSVDPADITEAAPIAGLAFHFENARRSGQRGTVQGVYPSTDCKTAPDGQISKNLSSPSLENIPVFR